MSASAPSLTSDTTSRVLWEKNSVVLERAAYVFDCYGGERRRPLYFETYDVYHHISQMRRRPGLTLSYPFYYLILL